jgi:hypothetical protein
MQPDLLNLDALRHRRLPHPPDTPPTVTQLVESDGSVSISRRQLIGLAGVAAVTLPPLGKAVQAVTLGRVQITYHPGRVAFRLGGTDRWVIDARRFSGSPRLTFRQTDEGLRIELAGARYPGTDVSADLVCEVSSALLSSSMKLTLALAGAHAAEQRVLLDVPVERWLAGACSARAPVALDSTVCRFGPGACLSLSGPAQADFSPDWVLKLTGKSVARLSGQGEEVVADSAALALLDDAAPSLLSAPAARRTLVSLHRGDHAWSLAGALDAPDGTTLSGPDSPFDILRVEAGEDDGGARRHALVAEASGDEPRLAFLPGGGLADTNGKPFGLPLSSPRYAAAFDGPGSQTALLADFAEQPVWMHASGCSLKLGRGPDVRPFEITHRDGRLDGFRCEPALLAMAAPLSGAIVEATPVSPNVGVVFVTDGTQVAQQRPPIIRRPPIILTPKPQPKPAPKPETQPAPKPEVKPQVRPAPGLIKVEPERIVGLVPLAAFIVDVVRPQDFLALQFQFLNLTLRAETGQPARLVRTKPGEPAHIVAHFPPQNIGEQAFIEASPEFLQGNQQEALAPPPVKSLLADRSRLVFQLPDDASELPFTLAALLEWSSYEPSVAPTALPPPAPPPQYQVIQRDGSMLLRPATIAPAQPGGETRPITPQLRRQPAPTEEPPQVLRRVQPAARSAAPAATARRGGVVAARPASEGLIVRPEFVAPVRLRPNVAAPTVSQTAIEAPYHLILSPNKLGAWLHSPDPVTHKDRTELWHTRLGVRSANGRIFESRYEYDLEDGVLRCIAIHPASDTFDHYRTLRAIWSPDYDPKILPTVPDPPPPFRMSLNLRDRAELVWLTANFSLQDADSRVIQANRLMLTSLGAWLDVRYGAELPLGGPGLSIEQWIHRATMGRDQYVRIVKKGYLFPFGHRASLIRVTERKFEPSGGSNIAYLRQRYFIIVREPEKVYPAFGQPDDARMMPLRRVRITTLVTPTLNPPGASKVTELNGSAEAGFWPRVGNQDFEFHLVADDWDGQRSEFTAPLIFVGVENLQGTTDKIAFNTAAAQTILGHYQKDGNKGRRQRAMYGQKVAFAESSAGAPGDTTMEAVSITFDADLVAASANDSTLERANQPRFYPTIYQADVRIPATVQIAGSQAFSTVEIDPVYVSKGWDAAANKGEVFLKLVAAQALDFSADKSGGIATPNLSIQGLSRRFGPLGGNIGQFAGGTFDPADFFSGAVSKLFGAVNLADIIAGGFGDGKGIPRLVSTPVYPGNDKLAPPTAVDTTLDWQPSVKAFGPFKPRGGAEFHINAALHTELAGGKSTYTVHGLLTQFAIDMLGFIILHFDKFEFTAASGQKMDVKPDISEVEFGGPLAFINELKDYLNFGGDSGGLSLDIAPTSITAGLNVPIPNVAVGVLTIQNIAFGASLHIPFLGDPIRLRFDFCKRENPFILTVSMFAGGGFFGIALGLDGVEVLEASLEFGASIAIDIGVASGGVHVMAGIYYKWEDDPSGGSAQLTGYVRLGGSLSVLGIITLSCEFYMGLTYATQGNKVWGEATLTVKIEILFFSKSVSMTCRREFADPDRATFKSLMPSSDVWAAYCDAFA